MNWMMANMILDPDEMEGLLVRFDLASGDGISAELAGLALSMTKLTG